MQARYDNIYEIIAAIEPCTVRQAFYQAVVRGFIEKTEGGYMKVQQAILVMRREGRIPYSWITDGTRWRIKPTTYSSLEQALRRTAETYRRSLWDDADVYVEIWIEKDALAGVAYPVTKLYDVGLHVARGFASESFLSSSAEQIMEIGKPTYIYQLGDHDPSGVAAAESIEAGLYRLAPDADITFERLAVTPDQITGLDLPTRPTKSSDPRERAFTRKYGHGSVELDAIHPDTLRQLVREAIEQHIDQHALQITRVTEESERGILEAFAKRTEKRQR
jgi:hypothetical protein